MQTTNKRVLLIRNAFQFDFGGGERFPIHLAEELQANGWQPIIMSRSPELLRYAISQKLRIKRGWWWSRQKWSGTLALLFPIYVLWQLALTAWYLVQITRLKPQVVHPQSKDDFIAATLAGKLLNKKIIWTDHADLKYVLANHQVWYKNPVGKLAYACSKLANTITLVSESEKKLIEEQLGHPLSNQFVVIHNGVKDEAVEPTARSTGETGKYIYVATSRLVAAKGITELIAAFSSLVTKYPDTLLWLIGDGPDEETFKQRAAGHPNIVFKGYSDKALTYVAAGDVFVHPSYHEGFSLSIIEATMLRKPVIACAVGGNPEIIKDNQTGLLIPATDPAALEKAMEKLYLDRPLAANLARAARQAYEKSFEFDKIVAERFIPLYES